MNAALHDELLRMQVRCKPHRLARKTFVNHGFARQPVRFKTKHPHLLSLPIKPGCEEAVRAWWHKFAEGSGWVARPSQQTRVLRQAQEAPAESEVNLVAQSAFLDQRNGQACVLIYSRLQRPAEPPPPSNEAAEQDQFFAANFDMAGVRMHELLFDVDRIAELDADALQRARQPGAGPHGLPITGQAQCQRIRILPGKLDQVREYCAALPERDGLRDVLRAEGVLIETMCLDHADDSDYLLFYSRVENAKASSEAFKRSRHPIDEEARAFMAETWDMRGVSRLEMIYDVDRIADVAGDGSTGQPPEGSN